MLIYWTWFLLFSGKVETRADKACHTVNKVLNWEGCPSFVNDFLWVPITVYLIVLILVRLYCVRILYYYAKKTEHDKHDEHEIHQESEKAASYG